MPNMTREMQRLKTAGSAREVTRRAFDDAQAELEDAVVEAFAAGIPGTEVARASRLPRRSMYTILERRGFDLGARSDRAREAANLRHERDRVAREHTQGTAPSGDDEPIDLLTFLRRRAGIE